MKHYYRTLPDDTIVNSFADKTPVSGHEHDTPLPGMVGVDPVWVVISADERNEILGLITELRETNWSLEDELTDIQWDRDKLQDELDETKAKLKSISPWESDD